MILLFYCLEGEGRGVTPFFFPSSPLSPGKLKYPKSLKEQFRSHVEELIGFLVNNYPGHSDLRKPGVYNGLAGYFLNYFDEWILFSVLMTLTHAIPILITGVAYMFLEVHFYNKYYCDDQVFCFHFYFILFFFFSHISLIEPDHFLSRKRFSSIIPLFFPSFPLSPFSTPPPSPLLPPPPSLSEPLQWARYFTEKSKQKMERLGGKPSFISGIPGIFCLDSVISYEVLIIL